MIAIYRLRFVDPSDVSEKVRAGRIDLPMAAAADDGLGLKPQNLVAGLPINQGDRSR